MSSTSIIILLIKQIGLPLRGCPILFITRMITDRIGLHSVLGHVIIYRAGGDGGGGGGGGGRPLYLGEGHCFLSSALGRVI